MNKKRLVRIVAIVLAFILVLSLALVAIDALTAKAATTQAQIDKLKEQKKDYDKKKQEIQSRINTIEYEKMNEIAKKHVLDDQITLIGMEIENIAETILNYEILISEKEREVKAAQKREDEKLATYRQRVRDMEENGVISYLEIIFDSTSFADLLSRIDFVGDIMRYDEDTYQKLIKARKETIAVKEDFEKTKQELEDEKTAKEAKNEELNAQLEIASALIEQINASLETEKALYNQTILEREKIQDDINKKVEKLRKEQEAARAAKVTGTGKFLWPLPSNRSVSSGYGNRFHPIYKQYRMHTGIDIGGAYGATIVAADAGTVIISAYSDSYGNYVVISHGNGLTTLYAHMSSRSVSAGNTVKKGQTIGKVGSTGVSTGAHLHFEVSVNGKKDNPMKYTYSY